MAEKRADALIELGTDDVFEFASLRVGLGIIDGEGIFEQALCEAMTAHYVASATITSFGEVDGGVAHLDEF